MLAQRSGIDVRRIVNPHPGGNLKGLYHNCLHWFCGKGISPAGTEQEKVANGAEM